jgi:acylphosphatase
MAEKQQAYILVSGRVQGVFFRDFACKKANSLGLTGFVQNTDDGKVEIIAEGDKDKIIQFIEAIKIGSTHANVKNCKIEWKEFVGEFRDFKIIY